MILAWLIPVIVGVAVVLQGGFNRQVSQQWGLATTVLVNGLVFLVVALLLFGPRKIPDIGRTLGKTMAEFRKATREFKINLEREVDMEDLRSAGSEISKARSEVQNVARDAMNFSPVSSDPPEAVKDQGSDDGNSRKD